jgi:predicted MFS family arabinose efflux permease
MVGIVFDSLPLFAAGAFVGSCAAVIGFLAESASIQSLVTPIQFPRANGRLQIVQSLAMLIAPALMGLVISWGAPLAGYAAAMVLAIAGFSGARGFGAQPRRAKRPRQPIGEIVEGYRFVRSQPLLMGIVACASFWNAGFFALIAVFIPFALGPIGLTAAQAGLAQAMMGIGSLTAALIAGWLLTIVSPRCILFFGPASSLVAAVVLVVASGPGGMLIPSLVFLSLGFGPILWLVCQNSVRQLVTPPQLLGRVGSVVQVAIYGVRAVGALASGVVAAQVGFDAAILLVIALFGAPTLSVYFSALGTLTLMPPQFVEAGAK